MTYTKNNSLVTRILLGVITCLINKQATAQSDLTPTHSKSQRSDDISYSECRNKVLSAFKNKASSPEQLRLDLKECIVKYPSAGLYVDCKAQVVSQFKGNRTVAKQKLAHCNALRTAATYNPEDPVLYAKVGERHFFAGADLGYGFDYDAKEDLPNFSCENLTATLEGQEQPEFLLFGNTPSVFPALRALTAADYQKKLRAKTVKKKDETYIAIPRLGRIYGSKSKNPSLFFPTAHCYFSAKLGANFSDHKIYYLIDAKQKRLLPYFGATFYTPDQSKWTVEDLKPLILKKLGSDYQIFPLKRGAYYFAKKAPPKFDEDGDPKDHCQEPRQDDVVAVLRTTGPTRPFALIVANMKNVCTFGANLGTPD